MDFHIKKFIKHYYHSNIIRDLDVKVLEMLFQTLNTSSAFIQINLELKILVISFKSLWNLKREFF